MGITKFAYAGHWTELKKLDELVDRLDALAFQAELMFWDLARADWQAYRYVTHDARDVADNICAGASPVCQEILERMAYITGQTTPVGHLTFDDWATAFEGNDRTLYAGSKTLELEAPVESSPEQAQEAISGVNAVSVTSTMSQAAESSTETAVDTIVVEPRKPRVATVKAVTIGLHNQINWLKHILWNVSSAGLLGAYGASMTSIYTWSQQLVDSLGINFATPLTAFYSLASEDTGLSAYDRPRVLAEFSGANTLKISCENVYDAAAACPQGSAAAVFHKLVDDDIIHVAKLDCEGYGDNMDRVYTVAAVAATYLELTAPSDIQIPQVKSEPAEEFGQRFILRKVKAA